MIAVRLLWLAVLLVAIPAWVGNCFLNVDKPVEIRYFCGLAVRCCYGRDFR